MSSFKNEPSSYELYLELIKPPMGIASKKGETVVRILRTMRQELENEFCSDFLCVCYARLAEHLKKTRGTLEALTPRCFILDESTAVECKITSYDAYQFLYCLARGDTNDDYIAEWTKKKLLRDVSVSNLSGTSLRGLLTAIDDSLKASHQQIRSQYERLMEEVQQNPGFQDAEAYLQERKRDADRKAEEIISKAKEYSENCRNQAKKLYDAAQSFDEMSRTETESDCKALRANAEETLKNAQNQAKQTILKAQQNAKDIEAEARQRSQAVEETTRAKVAQIKQKAFAQEYARRLDEVAQGLRDVQSSFSSTQKQIVSLESAILDNDLRKIFNSYYSLFEKIESYAGEAAKGTDEVLQDNLEAYLDIIREALEGFGITVVHSSPDTPFNGAIHEADTDSSTFHPASAVIERSLSEGFRIQKTGTVLKKELVRLVQEERKDNQACS